MWKVATKLMVLGAMVACLGCSTDIVSRREYEELKTACEDVRIKHEQIEEELAATREILRRQESNIEKLRLMLQPIKEESIQPLKEGKEEKSTFEPSRASFAFDDFDIESDVIISDLRDKEGYFLFVRIWLLSRYEITNIPESRLTKNEDEIPLPLTIETDEKGDPPWEDAKGVRFSYLVARRYMSVDNPEYIKLQEGDEVGLRLVFEVPDNAPVPLYVGPIRVQYLKELSPVERKHLEHIRIVVYDVDLNCYWDDLSIPVTHSDDKFGFSGSLGWRGFGMGIDMIVENYSSECVALFPKEVTLQGRWSKRRIYGVRWGEQQIPGEDQRPIELPRMEKIPLEPGLLRPFEFRRLSLGFGSTTVLFEPGEIVDIRLVLVDMEGGIKEVLIEDVRVGSPLGWPGETPAHLLPCYGTD